MLRSTLILVAGAMMLPLVGNTPAFAGGYESPIVRFRPGVDPDAARIPAPLVSPRWHYSAAYYNPPRGPKYFYFIGGARHGTHRRWFWR